MPIASAAGLLDLLRQHRLLSPAQLDEVVRVRLHRFPDPSALIRELIRRGWLTPYQVNQINRERAQELQMGPYVLLERLGEGGMGEVFKARHPLMDRTVAIKVIRKERLAHGDAVERFHREIRMAAQLDHPHIIHVQHADQLGGTHFLVMEYAEGPDLHRLVQKSGPLAVPLACAYIRQAALGLQHAHEHKLVHRDIKPSNLLVTAQGSAVKISDLGLARSQAVDGSGGGATDLTHTRMLLGTPDYIAPEQIVDPRQVDGLADLYSLGCTFYFLLAGRPPFVEDSWEEKLVAHRKQEPRPIEQLRPDVPPAVAAILRKMMAKRKEDRYTTLAGVADALAPFSSTVAVAVSSARSPLAPASGPGVPAPPAARSRYEAGWTLETSSTVSPPPLPVAVPPAAVPARPPVPPEPTTVPLAVRPPVSAPPGQSASLATRPEAGARKRLWLVLAGVGAGLALLILLLILLWPRGGEPARKGDAKTRASKEDSSSKRKDGKKSTPQGEDEAPGEVRQFQGHSEAILCVAFSPDGTRALSGGADKTVRLWKIADGSELHCFEEHKAAVAGVAFSPRGHRALSSDVEAKLKLWDLDGRKELRTFSGQYRGRIQVAFTSNGLRALSGGTDGYVREWNLASGLQLYQAYITMSPLAFTPDGQHLLAARTYAGKNFLVLGALHDEKGLNRANSGEEKGSGRKGSGSKKKSLPFILRGHTAPIFAGAFSRDESRLVSGGMDGTVRLWDAKTGAELHCLEGHQDPVTAVAFSPDGTRVLSGSGSYEKDGKWVESSDNSIRLWDVANGKEIHRFKGHPGGVTGVAFAPNGRFALSGGRDKLLRLWRLPR